MKGDSSDCSTREARKLVREVSKVLKRRGGRLEPTAKAAIESSLAEVRNALSDGGDADRLAVGCKVLRTEVGRRSQVLRKATVMEYVQSLGLAVGVALLIRAFIIEAFMIPTGSMIPTLMVDDHIFVSKFTYGFRIPFTHTDIVDVGDPQRGSVAVFEYPGEGEDRGKDFIKRIVAVGGDRVRLKDNTLYINGKPVPTKVIGQDVSCDDRTLSGCRCVRQQETLNGHIYVTQHMATSPARGGIGCVNNPDWPIDGPDVVVPEGHVLAMGDNRDNSSDGRYWGFVPIENFKGEALFIWWPIGRAFHGIQ
ncbi:MAG: signal peptidase I [Deltaproteobacteria bacterium]|nr:signal peptidase I [Deltaproteobacteria bacterium]